MCKRAAGIFHFLIVFTFFPLNIHSESSEIVYAFRNFKSNRPEKMILVGEIKSKTKLPVSPGSSPYKGYDSRMDQITVKVVNRRGIKIGQKLYIVDKNPHHNQYRNGLITGEIIVKSLFHSPFYGWVLTGSGILLRVREGNFVVRTLESENLEYAFSLKKQGDHFRSRGEFEKAIASYTKAVEADRGLPEAHAALGSLYFRFSDNKKAVPVKALSEFQEAYRHRKNFRYDYDLFEFCNNYMEVLNDAYSKNRMDAGTAGQAAFRMLDRIIELGEIASKLNESHPDILLHVFRANVYKIQYFSKRTSPAERDSYEASQNAALKSFLPLLKGPISSAETHRMAIHYFVSLGKDVKTSEASRISSAAGQMYAAPFYALNRSTKQITPSSDTEQRIHEMTRYHMELYYRYLNRSQEKTDPVIEEMKGSYSL